ncbi:MAG: response regulator transcription factor [Micrococcales bacterium]|nr:response regulator transcription factor [Micrococcales bacterium]
MGHVSGILVVDDDRTVGEVLLRYLERSDLEGRHLESAAGLMTALEQMQPDLLVLDVMLPDGDGMALCGQIRSTRPDLPVILLTARTEEIDRIAGLSAGADDYVVKPFSPRELVLRIQSVLRRCARPSPTEELVLSDGDVLIDTGSRTATRAGADLRLTAREFDLLAYFLEHSDQALGRDELLREVWEWNFGDKSTVTVHVRRLREKVETDPADPRRLVTVWGVGYRWVTGT